MKRFHLVYFAVFCSASFTLYGAATFVGGSTCMSCHEGESESWRGSHHDLAMAVVNDETVLGDFNDREITASGVTSRFFRKDGGYYVRTDGADGELHDYKIAYTFGWYPLQQYLIEFPRGRFQALGIAWDSRAEEQGGQRWFHLYPEEVVDSRHPLHWSGRDQTWNYQCAECHSTHLQKNYELKTDSYQTRWSDIDVACEACHGPGSEHVAWGRAVEKNPDQRNDADKGLVVSLADRDGAHWVTDEESGKPTRSLPRTEHTEIELCARCHSRRGTIWGEYEYGQPLADNYRLVLLNDDLYFPDGQIKDEVYVYGSFIQSRMYRAGVTCSDCHNPHSLELRAEGNSLCTRCHQPMRYDSKTHHHHETDSTGAACTACHMPQRTYMVVDERADHSLRVPRPDLSDRLGTPNACSGCHADKTTQWAAERVAGWYPNSDYRGNHFGETLEAATNGEPGAASSLLALAADMEQPGIVRATALDRLAPSVQAQHHFTLQRLLGDEDPLVRAAALRTLAAFDITAQVDLGWPLLEDPVRSVRLEAASLLAQLMPHKLPEKFRAQLSSAIREYVQSQAVNAERPESHLNIGLVATAMGKATQAEEAYRTALRLDPEFVPGYVNLVDLYRRLDKDNAGEKLLREAIIRVGEDADLQHALGLLLVRQKRLQEALVPLQKASLLAPDRPRYAYVYALALQGAGDLPQALAVLADVNERHPGRREILSALIELHGAQGNSEAVRRYSDELSRYAPATE